MIILTVAGRVVKDAEEKFTASGTAVLNFTVASDVGFGDKKHAVFVGCSLWGKRASALAPYIKKGMQITVSGNGDLRLWEANGKHGASIELNVAEVELQGSKQDAQIGNDHAQIGNDHAKNSDDRSKSENDFEDDGIPF